MIVTAALLSPPRTVLQKLLWFAACVAFFVLAYFAHSLCPQTPTDPHLEQAVRETDHHSPGWRLEELEAARATVPDDENSAFVVQRVGRELPGDWPPRFTNRFLLLSACLPDALTDVQELILDTELDLRIVAVAEARALADLPRGRHPLPPLDRPWQVSLQHVPATAQATQLLTLDALRRGNGGDLDGAARSCRGAFNAAGSFGDEPFSHSQLMRKKQASVACRGVQHLVNHSPQADPQTLAGLQELVEHEATHPGLAIALRGNRASVHALLTAVESGRVPWSQVAPHTGYAQQSRWRAPPTLEELRCEHAELLPQLARTVAVAEKPAHERPALLGELQSGLTGEGYKPLSPLLHGLPSLERNFAAFDALLWCCATALACERFRATHGRWPLSLHELTPDLLKETPLDPADGQPLRYRRFSDGIVIYSLLHDERGRQYNPVEEFPPHYGVAVRLWNVSQRNRVITVVEAGRP